MKEKGYNVIVYNKHSGENLLPNIGRESHTYLRYIVDNYNNLPDEVLFSQYDPLDHFRCPSPQGYRGRRHVEHFLGLKVHDFACIRPYGFGFCVGSGRKQLQTVRNLERILGAFDRSSVNKLGSSGKSVGEIWTIFVEMGFEVNKRRKRWGTSRWSGGIPGRELFG